MLNSAIVVARNDAMQTTQSKYRSKLTEAKELRDQLQSVESDLRELVREIALQDCNQRVQDAIERVELSGIGLNHALIINSLVRATHAEDIGLDNTYIGLQGNVPWDVDELSRFLLQRKFLTEDITYPLVDVIVLGARAVSFEELEEKISASLEDEEMELRIYTQELFMLWIITGEDPLETLTIDELEALVKDHEPLQFVRQFSELPWPTIERNTNSEGVSQINWNGQLSLQSPLSKMGYSVRADHLTRHQRQSILASAFKSAEMDSYLTSNDERVRWGHTKSAQRLYAMASLISWLSVFQGSTKPAAQEKWLEDLGWMRSTFYDKRMRFKWPY